MLHVRLVAHIGYNKILCLAYLSNFDRSSPQKTRINEEAANVHKHIAVFMHISIITYANVVITYDNVVIKQ